MDTRDETKRELATQRASDYSRSDGDNSAGSSFRGSSKCLRTVVATLSDMPEQAATDSLVRFAVCSCTKISRKAAATSLQSRPMFAYVPTLVAGLETLVQVQFIVDSTSAFPNHVCRCIAKVRPPTILSVHNDGVHENFTYGLTTIESGSPDSYLTYRWKAMP